MKKFAFVILIVISCRQDEVKGDMAADYILFGHFYGECLGEQCVEIFKLTKTSLFEDSNDHYPNSSSPYVGNFLPLSTQKFDSVNSTRPEIPLQLLATSSTVIGAPDAADGGGIYFEISTNGKKQFWLIDKMRANLPGYLIPFVDQIEKDIALIEK